METNVEEFVKLLEGAGTNQEKQNAANAQKAVADLQNIQKMLQPYLVGSKAFDAKSLQAIQKKLSAPETQQFFGRNDKKALQALQKINASINSKIKSLSEQPQNPQEDTAQPENNAAKPAETAAPDAKTTDNTAGSGGTPAQGNEAAAPQNGGAGQAVDQNAQKEINNVVNNTSDAQTKFETSLKALEKFKNNKVIAQLLTDWGEFKKSLDNSKNAAAQQ